MRRPNLRLDSVKLRRQLFSAMQAALLPIFGQEHWEYHGVGSHYRGVHAMCFEAVSEADMRDRAAAMQLALQPLGFSHFVLAKQSGWHLNPAIVG